MHSSALFITESFPLFLNLRAVFSGSLCLKSKPLCSTSICTLISARLLDVTVEPSPLHYSRNQQTVSPRTPLSTTYRFHMFQDCTESVLMENVERFNEETTEYCERVLNETENKQIESVKSLRIWLDNNAEYNAHKDAYSLVRYLRACKYVHERAIRKLECMYELRTSAPEWYKNRNPLLPEIQELMKLGVFLPLLRRDPEGRSVILIRATAHDPGKHLQNNVFKTGLMILDLFLNRFQDTSVYGVVAILDLKDVTLGHARQMTIPMIKKCVHSWQACYPVRIRSINFINSPSYVNVILNIFRKFMNAKLRKRVHVHGYDINSLDKQVPLYLLPPEYGGSGDGLDYLIDYWFTQATEAGDWFKEDEKYCYTGNTQGK